jgi:hypothetical protein
MKNGYRYWQKTFGRLGFEFEFNLREASVGLFYDYIRYNIAITGIRIPFLTVSISWDMMN